ncbi:MAG TPA: outer membrane lipoprotein-sorting protein [Candidatus Bipolaricaulota bacterium]
MKKWIALSLLLLLGWTVGSVAQNTMTDEELLGTMDFQRFAGYFNQELPGTTFTTEILAERPDGSKQATVQVSFLFTEEGFRGRIDYLTPDELKGDVFIIVGGSQPGADEIYFWNPDLVSPLKVNGRFEVFGDATVVEVVGIGFSYDYSITERKEYEKDGAPVLEVSLKANRPSVAFQQARVVADAQTLQPKTLELFDESGDLLHFNTFEEYGTTADGRPYFVRQLLDNQIVPVNQTLMIITNIENKALPAEMFDPTKLGA